MRNILGGGLVAIGFLSALVFGFWGLILDLRILNAIGGFWLVLAGLFMFPATLTLAPFYAGFALGDWRAVAVTIAGGLMLMLFGGIGATVFGNGAKKGVTTPHSSVRWYFSKTWWFPVRALLLAWFVYALVVSVLGSGLKVMASATVIMAVFIAKSLVLGIIVSVLLFPAALALALCAVGLYAWPLVAVPRVWQGGHTFGWKLVASFALIVGGALARFILMGRSGKPRAVLTEASDGNVGLRFVDAAERVRMALELQADGTPYVSVADAAGQRRFVLTVNKDGSPAFSLLNAQERALVGMTAAPDGTGGLVLTDASGHARAGFGIRSAGSSLVSLHAADGALRAALAVLPDCSPSLRIYGADGKVIWKAP